jgi:hypothetical protein
VHMMMYEADAAKRKAWIASVDAIAALNPKIVVAGHKSVGAANLPENLAASQRYLRDFTTVAKKGGTVEDLVLAASGRRTRQSQADCCSFPVDRSPAVTPLLRSTAP